MFLTKLYSFSPKLLGKLLIHLFRWKREFEEPIGKGAELLRINNDHLILILEVEKSVTPEISLVLNISQMAVFIVRAPADDQDWANEIPALNGVGITRRELGKAHHLYTFFTPSDVGERELLKVEIFMI